MRQINTDYKKNLSKKEVDLIMNVLEKTQKYTLIFKLMLFMGLRIGEIIKIRKQDIDKDFSKLRVELLKSHKVKDRIIPNKLKKEIRDHIKTRKITEYLFVPDPRSNSKNPHIRSSTLRWYLKRIRDQLKLNDIYFTTRNGIKLNRITLHTFRHYFITNFYYASGKDIVLTKDVVGHAKIETTYRYISPQTREKEVVNML